MAMHHFAEYAAGRRASSARGGSTWPQLRILHKCAREGANAETAQHWSCVCHSRAVQLAALKLLSGVGSEDRR